jgi:hypothetical protein
MKDFLLSRKPQRATPQVGARYHFCSSEGTFARWMRPPSSNPYQPTADQIDAPLLSALSGRSRCTYKSQLPDCVGGSH